MSELSLHDAWLEWDAAPSNETRVANFQRALERACGPDRKVTPTLAELQRCRREGMTYRQAIEEVLG